MKMESVTNNDSIFSSVFYYKKKTVEYKFHAFLMGLCLNVLLINDLLYMFFGASNIFVLLFKHFSYSLLSLGSVLYFLRYSKAKAKFLGTMFVIASLVAIGFSSINPSIFLIIRKDFVRIYLLRCLPAFLLFLCIDIRSLHEAIIHLNRYCLLWIVYALFGTFYIALNSVQWGQYSGNFGFNLLIPCCFSLYNALDASKKANSRIRHFIWVALYFLFLVVVLLRGSRTAFLCAIVFSLLEFFALGIVSTSKKIVLGFLILFIVSLFFLAKDFVNDFLISLFPSSRSLNLFLTDLSFDSGRTEIRSYFLNLIKQNPFLIRGVFSDRVYYSNYVGSRLDITNYPHNVFVEMFFQFGVVLGLILIVTLVLLALKTLFAIEKSKNNTLKFIFFFLLASGFVRLFFSSSYLTTLEFYALVGFSINVTFITNKRMS